MGRWWLVVSGWSSVVLPGESPSVARRSSFVTGAGGVPTRPTVASSLARNIWAIVSVLSGVAVGRRRSAVTFAHACAQSRFVKVSRRAATSSGSSSAAASVSQGQMGWAAGAASRSWAKTAAGPGPVPSAVSSARPPVCAASEASSAGVPDHSAYSGE